MCSGLQPSAALQPRHSGCNPQVPHGRRPMPPPRCIEEPLHEHHGGRPLLRHVVLYFHPSDGARCGYCTSSRH